MLPMLSEKVSEITRIKFLQNTKNHGESCNCYLYIGSLVSRPIPSTASRTQHIVEDCLITKETKLSNVFSQKLLKLRWP